MARRAATAATLVLVALGCVRVEPPQRAAGGGSLRLRAADYRDLPADTSALPRRPRLYLDHPAGLDAGSDAVFLLKGSAQPDDLASALARKPLSAAYLDRALAITLQPAGAALALLPAAALEPDADYTLAVGGWVRSAQGASLAGAVPAIFALATASGADAGARVVESWPADGAVGVGTNLAAIVIGLDGAVEGAEDGAWLQGPDGLAVPAQIASDKCATLAPEHDALACVRITPDAALAPQSVYEVVVGSEARDLHGAPLGPWRATFRTAAGPDRSPPAISTRACAVDEQPLALGCALVDDTSVTLQLQADEAVLARLHAGIRSVSAVAPGGAARLRLSALPSDSDVPLRLELRDAAGNLTQRALVVHTTTPLATLSIVEVRADPLGPEPQQELVELLNYGERETDLRGFTLSTRADASPDPIAVSARVPAHTRLLLVSDGFDPADPRDATPPPGAPLVRVGRALGGSGLANAGVALYLRDPQGRRVSAAPATPRPRPGVCNVRASADMRDGAPGSFVYDADDTCTPGR